MVQKSEKSLEEIQNFKIKDLDKLGKSLLFQALSLKEVLEDAFNSRQIQKLTDYLKALAASFHKYYNENRVLGSENEDSLLKLYSTVGISLKTGLMLIGIEAKARM